MREIKRYKVNPSWVSYGNNVGETRRMLRTKGTREGIVEGHNATIATEDRVLEFEYKGLYTKILNDGYHVFGVASKQGLDVLGYILAECLEFGKDSFIFVPKRCSEKIHLHASQISRGIKDLLENEVIFASDIKVVYFMNVTMFHKGDLENKYKEFIQTTMR